MQRFPRFFAGLLAAVMMAFFCASAYSGEYYKWTDEGGNIHFSDSLENVPAKYRNQIEKKRFEDKPSPVPYPASNWYQDKVRPAKKQPFDGKQEEEQQKKYEVAYTPYEGSSKRVIIPVLFNGSVTAPIAIDTGAPGTIISVPLAEKIGLLGEDQGRLLISTGGIGGKAPAMRTIIDTIQVGGAKSFFVPTTVIAPLSKSFDGLLGLDFFSNYSVDHRFKTEGGRLRRTPGRPGPSRRPRSGVVDRPFQGVCFLARGMEGL